MGEVKFAVHAKENHFYILLKVHRDVEQLWNIDSDLTLHSTTEQLRNINSDFTLEKI